MASPLCGVLPAWSLEPSKQRRKPKEPWGTVTFSGFHLIAQRNHVGLLKKGPKKIDIQG